MDELLEALSSAVDVELALKGSRDGELALQSGSWACAAPSSAGAGKSSVIVAYWWVTCE